MRAYYTQYLDVAAMLTLGMVLFGAILGIGKILAPRNMDPEKLSIYECGVEPVGGQWSQQQARYYVYALLFVIFDVEAAFIFPWARIMGDFGNEVAILIEMIVFIVILAMALVYAARKKLLVWS